MIRFSDDHKVVQLTLVLKVSPGFSHPKTAHVVNIWCLIKSSGRMSTRQGSPSSAGLEKFLESLLYPWGKQKHEFLGLLWFKSLIYCEAFIISPSSWSCETGYPQFPAGMSQAEGKSRGMAKAPWEASGGVWRPGDVLTSHAMPIKAR